MPLREHQYQPDEPVSETVAHDGSPMPSSRMNSNGELGPILQFVDTALADTELDIRSSGSYSVSTVEVVHRQYPKLNSEEVV